MTIRDEKIFVIVCAFLALMLGLSGCAALQERIDQQPNEPQAAALPEQSVHFFFGNPSNANQNEADNYLVVGEGSAISYSNSRGTPNWVSWRTTKADLGPSLKRPEFRPDMRLPDWFARVGPYDYSGSGYDRGHMVPSADRFGNAELNEETFLMTNIVPQTPELNQYAWEKLESYARGQARRGHDVYQIAGIYGTREMLKGKIAVPAGCWKIVAVLPAGVGTADRRMRIVAVDMPNEEGIAKGGWEQFRTSVRAIEDRTGNDFFSTLPREVQDDIETRITVGSP